MAAYVMAAPEAEQFPKRCGCGRIHDKTAWSGLDYVGIQDDEQELLELRQCFCGSTLGIVIGPSPCIREKGKLE